MRVTVKKLVDAGAHTGCANLRWFERRWPSGCDATLKNLEAVAEEDTFLLSWFSKRYLSDRRFSVDLDAKQIELLQAWNDGSGRRIVDSAKLCARRFVLGWKSGSYTIQNLRAHKHDYKSSRAAALVIIAHKLARMVYDKIKAGAAKKRRAK